MQRIVRGIALPYLIGMLLMVSACGGSGPQAGDVAPLKQEAMEDYAAIVHASYEDSLNAAVVLQGTIEQFVAAPSETTLQAAREAWLAAREPYGQTEAYRFYGGPIDDEDGPEGLLNAWPLDESYVDYVNGAPESGIINQVEAYPTIDRALLVSLNEAGAEENVSTGFHAIEFLLWGQDAGAGSAGQRPYTDYVAGGSAPNPERRAQYLQVSTALLVETLAELTQAWAPETEENYRAAFLAQEPDEALQKMLTGIGVLAKSELAGERIFTAYDNQDQEDEHSCFSDNTHRDIILNAQGIRNVYMGSYERTDGSMVGGTGLEAVMEAVAPELNAEMVALLEQSLSEVNEIPVPFDQAIVVTEQRPQVLEAVNALQDTGDKIAEVAAALDLSINTALP